MFDVLIAQLLDLQSKLESEKQARIELAVAEINKEFDENANKIQKALDDFGYVEPPKIEEEVQEQLEVETQPQYNI